MPVQRTPARVAFRRPWPGTRRGFCLWLVSIAVIFIGVVNSVATTPSEQTLRSLSFALEISGGSLTFWGLVMVAVGCVSLFCSFCHFGRDVYGYVIICAFTAGWGLVYITGLFYGAGLRSLGGAAIWLLFAAIFATVSGFPNTRLNGDPIADASGRIQ